MIWEFNRLNKKFRNSDLSHIKNRIPFNLVSHCSKTAQKRLILKTMMISNLFLKVMNLFKKRMTNLRLLKRKSHKIKKISSFLSILKWTPVKSVESLRLTFKKNLRSWCHNLWKKLKNLFSKSLPSTPTFRRLFTIELLVMNVESITLKESDTNALFVLISICVKIVKSHQVTAILSLKLSIQNKLLIKFSQSLRMIKKTLLKLMDTKFNYHSSPLWINYLMPLEELSNQTMEDSILDVITIVHTVHSKETLRKSKSRKRRNKSVWFKSLKKRQKFNKKNLLRRLSQKLRRNLWEEFLKDQLWSQEKIMKKKERLIKELLKILNILPKFFQVQSKSMNATNLPKNIQVWLKRNF